MALLGGGRSKKTAPVEQLEKLEKEMSQVQEKYQATESSCGSDLLNLVVAKGYLTKLLANEAVKSYISRTDQSSICESRNGFVQS